MKGGHDLGGQRGMGSIAPEAESQEPVFHEEWERRVFALTLATGMLGRWNIDESRHARERQDPARYVENSYYENWLEGLEKLLVEKELIAARELQNGKCEAAAQVVAVDPESAERILAAGASSLMEASEPPRFELGDRVVVKPSVKEGHTRAPRYAQGAKGIVVALLGCHSFPDSNAAGVTEGRQLYRVQFEAQVLWGDEREDSEVLIDLWEPYLQRAER